MESPQLPEKAAKQLRELRKRFKVAFEPLAIKNYNIELLKVTDLEALLGGKDPFKNVSEFPFWIKLWEASIVLANVVISLTPAGDRRLLEVGAGLGAPGLLAAAHGFKVTLSDYEPHILDFQRVSAAKSGLTGVEHRIIDWTKPPNIPQFDTIIGAEVIFREDLFEPLIELFKNYLTPNGVIFLAHDQRRKSLYPFMEIAAKDFKIMAKKVTVSSSDDEEQVIILNRLQRR